MDDSPVVVFMAGGTGGHIFPALATAEVLQKKGVRIHWLGTPDSMEADLVPRHGIDISFIPVTGLRGKGVSFLLKAPWKLTSSLVKAIRILKQHNPVCVVGMGGYVTGPGGVAAKLLGIPLVIHEQNAVAGMTNKLLAKVANRVLEAFPGTFSGQERIDKKLFLTGNPVRTDISEIAIRQSHVPVRLLIVGGSRGAVAINELIPEVLKHCGKSLTVWHQTGGNNLEQVKAQYHEADVAGRVESFIHDMAEAYDWADLVICRSGALTVAELAVAGRPAILVPYPYAVDDHQTVNGRYLVDQGAAKMIQQKDLDVESLTSIIEQLISEPGQLYAMAEAARSVGLSQAASKVAEHCLEVSGLEVSHV